MNQIDIYRKAELLTSIKPEDSSVQYKRVMGENQLQITFKVSHYILFKINDYCTVFGEIYKFNELPFLVKNSTALYEYSATMQAEGNDLSKAQFLFLGADNLLRESDFSLMGTAEDFINLVIQNALRVSDGWIKGEVFPGVYKNLTFSKENCYNALSKIAEAFETEFWIEGRTIHLTKIQTDTGILFRHGEKRGLYKIIQRTLDNSSLVTRLYANGSEKNLPPDYLNYSKKLSLPAGPNPCLVSSVTAVLVDNGDGTQTITFNWVAPSDPGVTAVQIESRPAGSGSGWTSNSGSPVSPRSITTPVGTLEVRFRTFGSTCGGITTLPIFVSGSIVTPVLVNQPLPYLEKNISKYGLIEGMIIFEDIFPHRTGRVTAINAGNIYEFTDTTIDFDVNAQLLPGLAAKVTFNTGQLSGYEFEISKFNNGTKVFTILKNKNEKVLDIPSDALKPAIGDTYVLTDIKMPSTYIAAAEAELKARALAYLDQVSQPQLAYQIDIDPAFVKKKNYHVDIGDLVWIKDEELEIERRIRIVSMTRNIVKENQYQVDLSDTVTPGKIERILSDGKVVSEEVSTIQRVIVNTSILNNNVIGDLKLKQGTIQMDMASLPTTPTTTGFSEILVQDATGKLYRKI